MTKSERAKFRREYLKKFPKLINIIHKSAALWGYELGLKPKKLKKKPSIYTIEHWDTFDNVSLEIGKADTLADAQFKIFSRYGSRIKLDGADKVEVIDCRNGKVVSTYNVG